MFIPGWIGAHFAPCQAGPIDRTCIPTTDPTSAAWADPSNRKSVLDLVPATVGARATITSDERIDGRIALQWRAERQRAADTRRQLLEADLTSNDYGYAAWFNGDDLRNVKYDSQMGR